MRDSARTAGSHTYHQRCCTHPQGSKFFAKGAGNDRIRAGKLGQGGRLSLGGQKVRHRVEGSSHYTYIHVHVHMYIVYMYMYRYMYCMCKFWWNGEKHFLRKFSDYQLKNKFYVYLRTYMYMFAVYSETTWYCIHVCTYTCTPCIYMYIAFCCMDFQSTEGGNLVKTFTYM